MATAKKIIPIMPSGEPAFAQETSDCAGAEPYALMVLGDSMLPEFEDGEIIVVEPEGLARDGSYVVAFHKDEYTFRQLVSYEGHWYLKPLNDIYPTEEVSGMEVVKGVVILKKKPGKRREQKFYV
jgi:DNA polymerase V